MNRATAVKRCVLGIIGLFACFKAADLFFNQDVLEQLIIEPQSQLSAPQMKENSESITDPEGNGIPPKREDNILVKTVSSCDQNIWNERVESDRFVRVSNTTYVYSAYYDARPDLGSPSVKVMGVTVPDASLVCHLWFRNLREPIVVNAERMICTASQ
jgi:hypothetical protein